jgi:hypothetical protein
MMWMIGIVAVGIFSTLLYRGLTRKDASVPVSATPVPVIGIRHTDDELDAMAKASPQEIVQ